MNIDVRKLTKGETGERVNLKEAYKWILNNMSYEDFYKFAQLHCFSDRGAYCFDYVYMVDKEHDTKKTREEYIKYLLYKLIQNLATPGVELRG